jgi:hypothetical protein
VPSQVKRFGMLPPLAMALLVSEKPPVFVELGFTIVVADGAEETGGIELAGIEVGAGVIDERGTVDGEFKTIVAVEVGLGAAVVTVVVVGGNTVVVVAVVRGAGAGRGMPFGLGWFRAATLNPEVLTATEADAILPVVIKATAIVVAIAVIVVMAVVQRAALRFVPTGDEREVEEVFGFVMTSPYGGTLNRHWESRNSFRQLLQRFLRLGS